GQDQLHALDMSTGAEAGGWPATVATTPDHNFIYSALTFNPANGLIYAETSSTCDISPWSGRIDVFSTSSAALLASFFPTQGQSGGGIWGYGGASIDASNDVYIAIGNADTTTGNPQNYGYAEDVAQLGPTLSLLAANYPNLPASTDADFGATPTLYQAPGCQPQLAAMNKSGVLVVYNRNAIAGGPLQIIQMSPGSDSGNFIGLPAYSPATNLLYVGNPSDSPSGTYLHGLVALRVQPDCTLGLAWQQVFGPNASTLTYDSPRSPPAVANGVVYAGDGTGKHVWAFDAQTGAQLWNSGSSITGQTFTQPVIDGHLFVSSYDGVLHAFGL
ncbi:pyrrolo-quinoline quinone, partial [bacterium]